VRRNKRHTLHLDTSDNERSERLSPRDVYRSEMSGIKLLEVYGHLTVRFILSSDDRRFEIASVQKPGAWARPSTHTPAASRC